MRFATLSLSLAVVASLHAQIQIGDNEMPHAGDELNRTQANANPFLNFAATGPDHEWDFSNLTAASEDLAAYQSVSSTNFVYALVYADIFFNPNRANHARAGVDIPFNQLLPLDNPYTFLYRSSSVYKKVGFGVELAGIPIPIAFTEHDVIYNLPLNYGDSDASSSAYNLSIPTLAYYGYRQERTNEVDGWGTIATPAGSFDVLRVKTTLAGHDTIAVDTLSLGFNIDRPIVHEYKWLAEDLRVPVLQINTTELFGLEVVTEIYFYDLPHTIAVLPPLAATLCPGSQFALTYDATGSYNAGGFFIPSNEFIAQLSNASGDFSNPVFLGQVTATVSGTINVTIPQNTPLGTGYRIRVISNSPAYIGTDNGFDITISDTPPSAVISAAGPTEFCSPGAVTLEAEPVAGSYQWQADGADIAGADGPSLEATTSGDYSLSVTNACGTAVSSVISVTVGEAPIHTLDQASYLSCDGTPVTITAVNNSGQTSLSYQWFLNGNLIGGSVDAELLAAESGDYSVEVTNTTTGCSYTTTASPLILDQVVNPVVNASGSTSLCEGGSVTLEVEVVAGLVYQWYLDGAAIADAVDPTLNATVSGDYTIVGTTVNGCASAPSAAVAVIVSEIPTEPTITALDATEFCVGGSVTLDAGADPDLSYQWSLDAAELAGETSAQLVATTSGAYSVVVTNLGGCSSTSTSTVEVTVNPLPETPVISEVDGVLFTTGTGSFQWFQDGNAIADATEASFQPPVSGNYSVTVTDANGCSSTSDVYVFISTGMAEAGAGAFGLYPNPTDGEFVITVPENVSAGTRYEIIDAAGRQVMRGAITGVRTTIDLRGHDAGLYSLRFLQGGISAVQRIVLN